VKVGDLIYWHGSNSIALVIEIDACPNEHAEAWWVCLLDEEGTVTDDLSDGFTIVDEDFDWPEWHVNYKEDK